MSKTLNSANITESNIIKGQEAICPDGLGRVVNFQTEKDSFKIDCIDIRLYADNGLVAWGPTFVELIDPRK